MKLYMTPGSCSTGIHILLEEIDRPFEAYIVNLPAGDHTKPDYLALNPKATIPTLVRNDGSVLTEFQAIAWWLARSAPKSKLLPDDAEGEARVIETMAYVVGTIHGQGFARIFTTDTFSSNPDEHAAVKARGQEIADAVLFYVEFWADNLKIALPPHCQAHYQRMLARPVVQRVLREEGYR